MDKFQLEYKKEDDRRMETKVGCVYTQVARARCDVGKFINEKGKKKHGHIVSIRREKYKEGERRERGRVKKSVMEFRPDFVRPTESSGTRLEKHKRSKASPGNLPVKEVCPTKCMPMFVF